MGALKDLTGQVFGRLTVIERAENTADGGPQWRCACECGNVCVVAGGNLPRGNTKSCGCLRRESTSRMRKGHGLAGSRPYQIWANMIRRCNDPTTYSYKNYGGRGIGYTTGWETFAGFWEDMSEDYEAHLTLDRIDNSKGYCKENCRWATMSVQAMNRRKRKGSLNAFVGVTHWPNGRYSARCCFEGKITNLGTFPTALQSAQAYDDAVEPIIGTRPNGTTKDLATDSTTGSPLDAGAISH